MPAIFTIPKPFLDPHTSTIQTNAIKGWTYLNPACEIFIIGDDPGVAETARQLGVKHLAGVQKNEFGTPLLSSAFNLARRASREDILVYANADIVFLSDFAKVFAHLPKDDFLACGHRYDLELNRLIDFEDGACDNWLKREIAERGKLHSSSGIDFFIFNKNFLLDLPDFAVGRVGWDNYVIYKARKEKKKIIDITDFTPVIHQSHGYPSFNQGRERKTNPEARKNRALSSEFPTIYNLDDVNHKLSATGLYKKNYHRAYSFLKRYLKFKLGEKV